LLAEACGKSKRQVQELLARRFPRPEVASSIRKRPCAGAGAAPAVATSSDAENPVNAVADENLPNQPPASANEGPTRVTLPATPRPLIQPLAPDRYRVTFTADEETCGMLEFARDLLRHALPNGEPAEIVKRSLRVLIEQLVKQKYAVTARPRTGRERADDVREPSAEVRRAVFIRDRGQCKFVGADGRRCGERPFVEFHHGIPYAAGGKPTVDNIELRCRAHNGYEAELFYGTARPYVPADPAGHDSRAVSPKTRFRSGTTAMRDQWRTPPRPRHGPAAPS
jgi:hypothetical protein